MLNKINTNPNRRILIVYIFLMVATLAVYWQLHQHSFIVYDDHIYVTENNYVQSGITLDGIRWAFVTTYGEFWHPLTWLSLMLDSQLYGFNAGGFHLTNLILHILTTLMLFWLFNRMTGAVWKSTFVAAMFSLHPLHVESVAWIAERKDVLSAFFWMLTLCFYIYYTEKPAIRRYLLVLFFFLCALMSKSMVVTLPVIMILLDYWPLGRFESKKSKWFLWQLKEKISFFILSAVFSIITFCTQYSQSPKIYPLSSRIANAPVSFVIYLEKIFWPHNLTFFYPFSEQPPWGQVLGAVLLIFVISAAVIIMAKRLPYFFVGWLWYAITILPVIGIVQPGSHFADRYTYLPSIGIIIMMAWGVPFLLRWEDLRPKILFPSSTAILVILSFLTWRQCGYWKDSVELYKHACLVTNSYLLHNDLAFMLVGQNKINEAIDHYNKAISIKPSYPESYINRGNAYYKLGQYQHAITDYNEAIRLQPDDTFTYNNRGSAYSGLVRYQHAIKDYDEAIRLKPDNVLAYNNRADAYYGLGQYQRAIEDFNKAIRLKPDNAFAYSSLGNIYFSKGNNARGCRDAQKACELGSCELLEKAKRKRNCR